MGPDTSVDNYTPAGLVPLHSYVATTTHDSCLNHIAAKALKSMFAAMKLQGLNPIAVSAFRNPARQRTLYKKQTLDDGDYPSIALPGHSEHQLGETIDISAVTSPKTNTIAALRDFEATDEYEWLAAHAASYGFTQSYQDGKESITGYVAESWHWRYVGIANAKAIAASGLTAFEFLENLQNQPN